MASTLRRWYVYHATLACRAANPLQVPERQWVRQCVFRGTEDAAATIARNITRQGVHARITSRAGTRHFSAM